MSRPDPSPLRPEPRVPFSVVDAARRQALAEHLTVGLGEPAGDAGRDLRLIRGQRQVWDRLAGECASALALIDSPPEVGVSSCLRGEGRTMVALGMGLAQSRGFGRKTVCVDFDLERPALARMLGAGQAPGVADVLRGDASLADCVQWVAGDLGVVGAGTVGRDASRLMGLLMDRGLTAELRAWCDAVVVDLPPFAAAGVSLARACEKVILVVRAGRAPMEAVRRVAAELGRPPVVLAGAPSPAPWWLGPATRGPR